jgi:steroid 5-alpha reductase family enzyme
VTGVGKGKNKLLILDRAFLEVHILMMWNFFVLGSRTDTAKRGMKSLSVMFVMEIRQAWYMKLKNWQRSQEKRLSFLQKIIGATSI